MEAKLGSGASACLHQVAVPMHRPFGHARKSRSLAESMILHIRWRGLDGFGECVARPYVTGESLDSVFAAIQTLEFSQLLMAANATSFSEAIVAIDALDLPGRLKDATQPGLAAACCVELALLDLVGRRFQTSLARAAAASGLAAQLPEGRMADHRFTRALDSSRDPDEFIRSGALQGFQVLKIKVGLGRDEDLRRVRRVRELIGNDFTIALDANMAWSLETACQMVDLLRPYGIAWYEEPLRKGSFADYGELRRQTGARVMLDESLCAYEDAEKAIDEQACDLFNIRLSKHGGFLTGLRLAELARSQGLEFQMGTHPGSQGFLRAAEWHFANSVSGFVTLEAARTNVWVEHELIAESLDVDYEQGRLIPLSGHGWGVTPIYERLTDATVRSATWMESRGSWDVQDA